MSLSHRNSKCLSPTLHYPNTLGLGVTTSPFPLSPILVYSPSSLVPILWRSDSCPVFSPTKCVLPCLHPSITSSLQCGGHPLPNRYGPLPGGGAIPHHHAAGSYTSSVEGSAHPVSLLVPLPSILSHLSLARGDVLVGCLLYWMLTTRLEAACYLIWTHSSRESQMQGSAVGEWTGRFMGQDGAAYMCICLLFVCFSVSECVWTSINVHMFRGVDPFFGLGGGGQK